MRNCETRPISWKVVQNQQVARAVIKEGYEVDRMWEGILTWRDNLGYLDASPVLLQDLFFALFNGTERAITVEKALACRRALEEEGLIIVYRAAGREYMLIPKVGNHGGIVGNMTTKSNYPPCPQDLIESWQQRFNDVYTPPKRRINDVYTPYKQCPNGVYPEDQGQSEGKDKSQSPGSLKRAPKIQPKTECDFILPWMKGLGLNGKEQTEILLAWHRGLKARGECYDCEKCRKRFFGCIDRAKKAKPKHFGPFLVKTVSNEITGN